MARLRAARLRSGVALAAPLLLVVALRRPAFVPPPSARGSSGSRRAALLGGGGAAVLGALPPALGGLAAAPGAARAQLTPQELRQVELFDRTSPSVVSITEAPDNKRRATRPQSAGSAFVWDENHIVTNFHVVADMVNPYATFLRKDNGGNDVRSSVPLVLVGADPLSDIAVLQVPSLQDAETGPLVQPLQRGSSSSLVPGQEVFALGNPYGLEHSMSHGIISGVSRTMPMGMGSSRPMEGVIQTDASINPGNSGGPLLDSEGRVVGMNAAILSDSGSFSGVGLAIPIDLVKHHVGNIISSGYVSRAALGVTFAPSGMSQALGIDGAMVMQVVPEGPASKAGVKGRRKGRLGDVIVSIEGQHVSSSDEVVKLLDKLVPGRKVRVKLMRASPDVDSDKYVYVDLNVELGNMRFPMVAV